MNHPNRRRLVKSGVLSLLMLSTAGCLSNTETRPDSTTAKTPTESTTGTQSKREFGPWTVELENELEDEVSISVEIRTSAGYVVRNETYDLDPEAAIVPITVEESGQYTATVSTSFSTEKHDFIACGLNSDLHVTIRKSDTGPTLAIMQRHQDPGTQMAGNISEMYDCDE